MLTDIRHACRSIFRAPVVSAVIVLSLGAGIGINTVVFSWLQARILDPIPGVRGGAAIRLIEPKSEAGIYTGASWPEFREMRERLTSLDDVFAAGLAPFYLGRAGEVERIIGLLVSDNYFSALRLQPALGRFFRPEDVRGPGLSASAVISHRIWISRYQGRSDVLSQTVRINGAELPIIGVTPAEFQGTTMGLQVDAWLPAALAAASSRALDDRSVRGYAVMARLAPGVSEKQAQAEIDGLMRNLAGAYPATNAKVTAEILPFHMSPRGPQRMLNLALVVLQGIMVILLLAVCGNVANLLLARASARQREIGIRLSLGARPWRVAALLLSESALLALCGAGLGILLAIWGTQGLLVLPMVGVPIRFQTSIDIVGMAFATCLGMLAGLIAGAAPAIQLARTDPHAAYRAGVASAGRSRLRNGLMAVQVGLAVMVLIVAGLFFRAVVESRTIDPGFRREGTLLATYDLSGREVDAAFSRNLARRALEQISTLPDVQSAAIASSVPLDIHGLPSRMVTVDGHARADGGFDEALSNTVSAGYFDTMGIPLLSGRDFKPLTDTTAAREIIVNEEFVRRYVQGGEPLGRQVRGRGGPFTIIGVVRNSIYNAFGEPPTPAIYLSYRDVPQPRGEIHVRLRGSAGSTTGGEIARVMRDVDAELPVFNLRTMDQHIDTNLLFRKIPAQMFAALGPMLLGLAAIGIYAVVSYAVSLRTREIGVRLALGATARRVVQHLVSDSLSVAVLGGFVGWGAAFVLVRAFGPDGRIDPLIFAVVPIMLLSVAAIACWVPARRAARVDPAITLKAE